MSISSPYSSFAFKQATLYFLTGKIVSALLSLGILLLLVHLLPMKEYGTYVVLVAGMEITLAVTTLGLPWVALRYLPEFRLYASGKMLMHFVWQVVALISLSIAVSAFLLLAALPWLLPSELTQYTDVVKLYLLLLFIEGLGRHIRESILGPLMQQGRVQISQVLRNLTFLLLIGIIVTQETAHLYYVVFAELVASMLGTILALYGLIQYLEVCRDLQGKDSWQPSKWLEMWRTAGHMYLSNLVAQIHNPQMFVFLIQRYLDLEATALFGFLRNLYGQVANYLPAALLSNLIRPKLAASFVSKGGMIELTRSVNLIGKLSMFALMPILIFVWLAGSELTSLLSGGKFNEVDYYLAGLLLTLIPLSQRQLLEFVAVVSEKSHLCFGGAVFGALALPMAYFLLESGQGLWGCIISIVMSQILFSGTLIIALMHTTAYHFDVIGFFKLIAAAVIGFVFIQQLALSIQSWLDLFFMAILSCILFLLVAYFIKPFYSDERERLNRLFNRNIFVW